MLELVELHRADITQVVVAERPHRGILREPAGLLDDVAADHDLSAVGHTHDPSRLVDRHADQPSSSLSHLADMQAHADADTTVRRPLLPLDPTLRVQRTLDRRSG